MPRLEGELEFPVSRKETESLIEQTSDVWPTPEFKIADLYVEVEASAPTVILHGLLWPSAHRPVRAVNVGGDFQQIEDSVRKMKNVLDEIGQLDPNVLILSLPVIQSQRRWLPGTPPWELGSIAKNILLDDFRHYLPPSRRNSSLIFPNAIARNASIS
jgi:hypothetical protein